MEMHSSSKPRELVQMLVWTGTSCTPPTWRTSWDQYVFDYGFGPYRWVCSSGNEADLRATDQIAMEVLNEQLQDAPSQIRGQILDNIRWISEAEQHQLVVGSKARILYADGEEGDLWPRGSTRRYPAGESQRQSSLEGIITMSLGQIAHIARHPTLETDRDSLRTWRFRISSGRR